MRPALASIIIGYVIEASTYPRYFLVRILDHHIIPQVHTGFDPCHELATVLVRNRFRNTQKILSGVTEVSRGDLRSTYKPRLKAHRQQEKKKKKKKKKEKARPRFPSLRQDSIVFLREEQETIKS